MKLRRTLTAIVAAGALLVAGATAAHAYPDDPAPGLLPTDPGVTLVSNPDGTYDVQLPPEYTFPMTFHWRFRSQNGPEGSARVTLSAGAGATGHNLQLAVAGSTYIDLATPGNVAEVKATVNSHGTHTLVATDAVTGATLDQGVFRIVQTDAGTVVTPPGQAPATPPSHATHPVTGTALLFYGLGAALLGTGGVALLIGAKRRKESAV